ncbi:RluA family pseudouridine synthase [Candidatus Woesearchaeota archaeon]|nr:RluA family pseudouridine synthase [Candidatus Woesearchaeota archaeon]
MTEQIRQDHILIAESGTLYAILLKQCDFFHTREQIDALAKHKRIVLNKQYALEDVDVKKGDSLILLTPQSSEPIVAIDYSIIYEDEFMFAVNKPANLPVHPAGKYYFNTLVSFLRKDGKRVYPINRLDKETSGIVLFATNPLNTRALQLMYEKETTLKTYFAVVFGELETKEGVINKPLLQTQLGDIRDHMIVSKEGKPCATLYKVIEIKNGFSLVQITLLTGRRHQIRAHFSSIGHPLVGDKQYSLYPDLFLAWHTNSKANEAEIKEKLLASRQLLHCAQLTFVHPKTGEKQILSAPLPKDMLVFLHKQTFTSF